MSYYRLIRQLLFQLEPESAHHLALNTLNLAHRLGISKLFQTKPRAPLTVMGLAFANPIGLAAGFDRNGEYIDALARLGFGFIEVGTVLPRAHQGHSKPRLFRLVREEALINRIGLPSKGLDYVVTQLNKMRYRGILGINIGKQKETDNLAAIDDFQLGFRTFWPYASYISINISSPNMVGLRDLQDPDLLNPLLQGLKETQRQIHELYGKYVPLVIKISPDQSLSALDSLIEALLAHQVDGVIAANTTIDRSLVATSPFAFEAGGLSGKPLQQSHFSIIAHLARKLQNKIPIIASGGIMDASSADQALHAGASLLQVYTGLIYQGPGLVKQLVTQLSQPK